MYNILYNIIRIILYVSNGEHLKRKREKCNLYRAFGTTNREYCLLLSFVHNIIYYAAVVAAYNIKHKNM